MAVADYEEFANLDVSIERGIAVVRSKEGDRDEIEHSFFNDIRDMFVPLGRDPDVRAVVLSIEHPPRTRLAQTITQASLEARAGRFLTIQQFIAEMTTFRKPAVGAVTGPAHAITANIALMADVVIASTTASFNDTHVRGGLAAGDGGTALWPFLVGPNLAKQVLLLGREISAKEAHHFGLVAQVVEPDAVLPTAISVAEQLAALPRVGFLATKLAINNYFRLAALIAMDITAAYEAATIGELHFARQYTPASAGNEG